VDNRSAWKGILMKTLPARSEIPTIETWNLETIFPDIQTWEKTKDDVTLKINILKTYEGQLSKDSETLAKTWDLFEQVNRKVLCIQVYGMLANAVDTNNSDTQALFDQGIQIENNFRAASAFIEPELIGIGFEKLREWIKKEKKLIHLGQYINNLERIKKHINPHNIEKNISLSMEPLSDFYRTHLVLINADLHFKHAIDQNGNTLTVGQSNIFSLLSQKDRKIRETAFKNYADGYLDFKNTIASIELGCVHRDIFTAKTHHYNSALELSLDADNIPEKVFSILTKTFKENLPVWHRYWRVLRKALGYKELFVYDIKAPLSDDIPVVPYEQAVDWICEALSPMGDEYIHILRKGALEERWVDRACNLGKRQGAFSSGKYDTNPFVMISYSDNIFSMSLLAHELGHSMHSYYTRKYQPFIYGHYSLFAAEVASNFHQSMVREYLFKKHKEVSFQKTLINETMWNLYRFFFIMPILSLWEIEIHKRAELGKPLTANSMIEICSELIAEGFGGEVNYDKDRIGITWAQYQQTYQNFYNYQYATGIAAAYTLSEHVLNEGKEAAERYINFLKTGSAKYPVDALREAGVDMTSAEPMHNAYRVLKSYIDRLEAFLPS